MVVEEGTRNEFKASVIKENSHWPRVGFTYAITDWTKRFIVIGLEGDWIHIITVDSRDATSLNRSMWNLFSETGVLSRIDVPWQDTSEIGRTLHRS